MLGLDQVWSDSDQVGFRSGSDRVQAQVRFKLGSDWVQVESK